MKKYLKNFLHRGLMFGGFGPIIVGIIYAIESTFTLSGTDLCIAIISSYLLAFIQAGATVFNQVESFSTLKSLALHFLTLYIAYVLCYIINSWIPFNPIVILAFTLIFACIYLLIWLSVYLSIKVISKKINSKLN